MGLILALIGAAVVGVIGFGVTWLVAGRDGGVSTAEPDGVAVPLPSSRPLTEGDVAHVRFDTTMRGYRMGQVDAALRRAAYDLGYKEELISVLEAEVEALRDGRDDDAEALRRARLGAEPKPLERPAAHPSGSSASAADRAWSARSKSDPESNAEDASGPEPADEAVNSANGTQAVNSANGTK
jgi:DivIVA domain-containing protein